MKTKLATISELRSNLARHIEELESGPLMLIQRSRPAGYLVEAQQFEDLINRIEDLEDLVEGMVTLQEILADPDSLVDAEEVFEELGI